MDDRVSVQVQRQLLNAEREAVIAVCEAGRAVATSWSGTTVTEPHQVTEPLANRLGEDVRRRLLDAVTSALTAAGQTVQGQPVPAPPYFVVTSRGPLCRVTLDNGRRLVVRFDLFAVQHRPRAYRHKSANPKHCLTVKLREK
ncbi:hypothetical protein ACFQJ7_16275 [Halovenus rubra]|uniref:Uncharacterized protein n=2 Tax=Halovenus rubra TaxID=869890 RepID=A0ACC7E678_9EURY|nr:hypothetical protein [Halovenus rubra]